MDQQQIVADYERRARALNISIDQLCREAGIAASTFCRWKVTPGNPEPVGMTVKSGCKIEAALKRLEQQARRRPKAA